MCLREGTIQNRRLNTYLLTVCVCGKEQSRIQDPILMYWLCVFAGRNNPEYKTKYVSIGCVCLREGTIQNIRPNTYLLTVCVCGKEQSRIQDPIRIYWLCVFAGRNNPEYKTQYVSIGCVCLREGTIQNIRPNTYLLTVCVCGKEQSRIQDPIRIYWLCVFAGRNNPEYKTQYLSIDCVCLREGTIQNTRPNTYLLAVCVCGKEQSRI